MLRPKLMLFDEPSFGLAPLIVEELFDIFRALNRPERSACCWSSENAALALELADEVYLIETRRPVRPVPRRQLRDNENIRRAYFGY